MNRGICFVRSLAGARSLAVLALVLFLSACGGGGGGSSTPSGDGSLSVTPSSLTFSAEQNGTLPSSQTLNFYSSNSQTYNIYAGYPKGQTVPSWLDMNFSNTSSSTLLVSVNTTNLAPGTYSTTIRLVSAKIDDTIIDYKDVPVTFYVTSPVTVSANPTSLSFSADEGVAPAAQTVSLSVTGGSMPSWSATAQYQGGTTGWLSLTPNASNNTIQVAVNPLGAGTYNANVVVSYTTAGGNKTLSIPVSYTAVSTVTLSQNSLAFTAVEGEMPASQNVDITFGTSTPSWSASATYTSGSNWLTLSQSGNTLTVQPAAQLPGTYSGSIKIQYMFGSSTSTLTIPVSYTVSSGVAVSSSSLNFSAVEGENPPAQALNLSYSGSGSLSSWSASISYASGSGWLSLDKTTGSAFPATINVDPGILSAGNYQATITIQYSFGSLTGSKSVQVAYNVTSGVSLSQSSLSIIANEGEDPAPSTIDVTYSGTGTLTSWSVSTSYVSGSGWLTVTPASGTSFPATLSIDPSMQAVGNYTAQLTVNYSFGSVSGTRTINVSYTVNQAVSLSTNSLSFTANEGEDPAAMSVDVTYPGSGTLTGWSISTSYTSGSGWLTVTPASGTSFPATLSIDPSMQAVGSYAAQLTLNYSFGSVSGTRTINVSYTVNQAVSLSKNSLSFTAYEGEHPAAVSVDVTYPGSGTLTSWSVSTSYASGSGWLTVTPASGTSFPATLSIDPSTIAAGTYSATLTLNYSFGSVSGTRTIDVTYVVNQAVTLSSTSLTFNAIEGEDPAAQDLTLTNLSSASVTAWGATISYTTTPTGWLSLTPANGNALPATISADVIAKNTGTYTATINISYSINGVSGALAVPVTYKVVSGVSFTPTSVSFSAVEGQQPNSTSVAINYTGTATIPWTAAVFYTSGTPDWLNISATSGASMPDSVTIQPNAMVAGAYSAYIRFIYVIDGIQNIRNVFINYTVASAWADPIPANISFTVGAATTINDLSQTVVLGDTYTNAATINWTASSDVDWLTATPASGDTDTNNTLTVSVVEANIQKAFTQPSGNIILTPSDPNVTPKKIPVTINFTAPYIFSVNPYVGYTGRPAHVILRGKGFNSINTANVSFAGTAADSVTVVSDTEMDVLPPASVFNATGVYHVTIASASVLDLSSADLNIVDPDAYSATSLTLAGTPVHLIYDPKRKAVFYTTSAGVYRLTYSSGTTWTQSSLSLANSAGINLSVDGMQLLVTTAVAYNNNLHFIDPDALTVQTTVPISTAYDLYKIVSPMNNGKTLALDTDQWGNIYTYPDGTAGYVFDYGINAILSADRNTLVYGGSSYSDPLYRYNASDDSFANVIGTASGNGLNIFSATSGISAHSERIVIGLNVYDSTFALLGTLDAAATPTVLTVSPDGSKVYAVTGNQLSAYDLSGTTSPFPLLGGATTFTADTTFVPTGITISEDGDTLFIYNATTLYVQPVP